MNKRWMPRIAVVAVAALGLFALGCSDDDDAAAGGGGGGGGTLAAVVDRDELKCGVKETQPGFGFLEPDGTHSGNDAEFCRAVAAAVLGDSGKVEFILASAADRFALLASGEIDVLIRTTTWTLSRDADLNGDFTTTTFYDGQGMLVRSDSGITSLAGLDGGNICVTTGTTTESNLDDRFNALGLSYTPVAIADDAAALAAFTAGQCDGWTADKSNLAGQRSNFPEGEDAVTVLAETMSKEPLGPLTRDDDSEWHDIVQWVVFGMINAEELGVTSQNVSSMASSPPNASVARLLGVGLDDGAAPEPVLGIDADFMQAVLAQIGNYGEVYARTLEPIGLTRAGSLNALWTEGGLIYGPPGR